MINLNDPLAVLATDLDGSGIETSQPTNFESQEGMSEKVGSDDLFGANSAYIRWLWCNLRQQ